VGSLPKLNYRSQRLRELMYAGNDAMMRYWLRPPFSIDGWRIDVASMLARQGASQLGIRSDAACGAPSRKKRLTPIFSEEHFLMAPPTCKAMRA
jgi:alpha-glucosidase